MIDNIIIEWNIKVAMRDRKVILCTTSDADVVYRIDLGHVDLPETSKIHIRILYIIAMYKTYSISEKSLRTKRFSCRR